MRYSDNENTSMMITSQTDIYAIHSSMYLRVDAGAYELSHTNELIMNLAWRKR